MKFYKVICGDIRDHFSGYTTIQNELLTEKERNKKFRYSPDNIFREVKISCNKTFWSFGARFEMKADKQYKKTDVPKMSILEKAIKQYKGIDTAAELKKNKLSLCSMDILRFILMDLIKDGKAETFNTDVAKWCKKNGLRVIDPQFENVNYIITV